MDSIRAFIIGDNQFMTVVLNDMLMLPSSGVKVLGIARTREEALKIIHALQPDVVFMDLNCPI